MRDSDIQDLDEEALIACIKGNNDVCWCNERAFCMSCYKNEKKKTILKSKEPGKPLKCPECGFKESSNK